MSSQNIESDSLSESGEERRNIEARIRDLEVEVYGYDSEECSAGRQAVIDVKRTVVFLNNRLDDGVSVEDIYRVTDVMRIDRGLAEQAFQKLRRQGEVYQPADGVVRPT